MRDRFNLDMDAGQAMAGILRMPAVVLSSALGSFAQMTGSGCGRPLRHRKITGSACLSTDIKWIANAGEVRVASILIENNQARAANVTLKPALWTDSDGNQVSGGNLVSVPASLTLKPGEAATVRLTASVSPPLQPGMAYFTEIQLIGCPKRSISVGLVVNPLTRKDIFVSCNRCCGYRPCFLEVCRSCGCPPRECHCESDCGCCSGSSFHESCCHCEPCSPWPGCWDPHCHWMEDCEVFHLPRQFLSVKPNPGVIGDDTHT